MKHRSNVHMVDLLFSLALFCVLAASALMVVVIGANVYRGTVQDMTHNYNTRTSLSYLAEKVRQGDLADGIRIGAVDGSDALVLTQRLSEGVYETWIYAGGGELREVMVASGTVVKSTDGQPIMPMQGLTLLLRDSLLSMTVTDAEGATSGLTLGTRCR